VVVGLPEIYQQVMEISRAQATLSGQIQAFIQASNTQTDIQNRELRRIEDSNNIAHSDYEKRLRALETRAVVTPKMMWTAVGSLTAMSGVAVAIISLVTR
jgi:hypothetical protein